MSPDPCRPQWPLRPHERETTALLSWEARRNPLKGGEAAVQAPVGWTRKASEVRRSAPRQPWGAPTRGWGSDPGVPPSLPAAARASPVSSAWRSPADAAEGDAAAPADPDERRPRRCRGTRSHPSAAPATNSPKSSREAQRRRRGQPEARPGAAAGGALPRAAGHSLAASCPGPRRLENGLPPGGSLLPSPAARGARLPAAFIGSGYLKKKKKKVGARCGAASSDPARHPRSCRGDTGIRCSGAAKPQPSARARARAAAAAHPPAPSGPRPP